jgi:hypothetical protein
MGSGQTGRCRGVRAYRSLFAGPYTSERRALRPERHARVDGEARWVPGVNGRLIGLLPSFDTLRQVEIHGGPLIHRPLRPDLPVVPVDDALHGREADAGAGKFRLTVQALERPE